jgi:hypothetical protein
VRPNPSSPTRRVTGQQRERHVRIEISIFHAKKRLTETVKKTHRCYKYFCELMSDAFFVTSPTDWERERVRATQLIHKQNKKKNMTLAKAAERARKAMKRFRAKYNAACRRIVTDPERLEKRIRQVIELFTHVKDATTDSSSASKKCRRYQFFQYSWYHPS